MNTPALTGQLLDSKTPPAEALAAKTSADRLFTACQGLVVDSQETYEMAGEELVSLRERWKAIEAQRVHLKEPYLEGGRRIDEFFRAPLARLEEAAELVKSKMIPFKEAEDRKAEEARRAEEARQRAEREALLQAQREAEARAQAARDQAAREAREAQDRADEARRQAEADAAAANAAGDTEAAEAAEAAAREAEAQAEADAQAARDRAAAEELAAQQQADAAQTAMDLADVAPAALVPASQARAAGVSGRKTWKVDSVDKRALVIAAGKAAEAGDDSLLAYLDVNETALNAIAKGLKGAARVAGVIFREFTTLATTGRR